MPDSRRQAAFYLQGSQQSGVLERQLYLAPHLMDKQK
jgi:hypothetical protein